MCPKLADKLRPALQVAVSAQLDPAVPYDLLLVPVKGHQVADVLPTLRASAAKTVMFNSVTFASLAPMREAVGAQRFAYGFPKFPAIMKDGRLQVWPCNCCTCSTSSNDHGE